MTVLVDPVSTPVTTIHPHGYKDATAKTMRDIQQWSITRRPATPLTNDTYVLSSIVLAMASLIFVFHWMRPREDAETLRPDQGVRHAVTRYSSTLYSSCSVCGYYSQALPFHFLECCHVTVVTPLTARNVRSVH